jgi:hypothetical protein
MITASFTPLATEGPYAPYVVDMEMLSEGSEDDESEKEAPPERVVRYASQNYYALQGVERNTSYSSTLHSRGSVPMQIFSFALVAAHSCPPDLIEIILSCMNNQGESAFASKACQSCLMQ